MSKWTVNLSSKRQFVVCGLLIVLLVCSIFAALYKPEANFVKADPVFFGVSIDGPEKLYVNKPETFAATVNCSGIGSLSYGWSITINGETDNKTTLTAMGSQCTIKFVEPTQEIYLLKVEVHDEANNFGIATKPIYDPASFPNLYLGGFGASYAYQVCIDESGAYYYNINGKTGQTSTPSTNASAVINSAIVLANGKSVYLKSGYFTLTAPIIISTAGCTLYGDKYGSILDSGATDILILQILADNVTVSDLTFRQQAVTTNNHSTVSIQADYCTLKDTVNDYANTLAIYVNGSFNVVKSNLVQFSGLAGILVAYGNLNAIESNLIRRVTPGGNGSNGGTGIDIGGIITGGAAGYGNRAVNNIVDLCSGDGLAIHGNGTLVQGNILTNNGGNGVLLSAELVLRKAVMVQRPKMGKELVEVARSRLWAVAALVYLDTVMPTIWMGTFEADTAKLYVRTGFHDIRKQMRHDCSLSFEGKQNCVLLLRAARDLALFRIEDTKEGRKPLLLKVRREELGVHMTKGAPNVKGK